MSEASRTVWRVLAELPDFVETFHERAAEAFLDAQAMEAKGAKEVEVNRVTLRAGKLSRVDLLSRLNVFEKSEVVPVEKWRTSVKRVRPIGAAATQERAERDMESA